MENKINSEANLNYLFANDWKQTTNVDKYTLTHPSLPQNVELTIEQALRKQAQILLNSEKEQAKEKQIKSEKTLTEQLESKGWFVVDGFWYHPQDEFKIGISDKKLAIETHSKRKFCSLEISELPKQNLVLEIKYKKSLEIQVKLQETIDSLHGQLRSVENKLSDLENSLKGDVNFKNNFFTFIKENFKEEIDQLLDDEDHYYNPDD